MVEFPPSLGSGTLGGKHEVLFGRLSLLTGETEVMPSPSFDYFERIEEEARRVWQERVRREVGEDELGARQPRRYVIYEKQPEEKEKKKKKVDYYSSFNKRIKYFYIGTTRA